MTTLDLERIREERELNRRAIEDSERLLQESEDWREQAERRLEELDAKYEKAVETLRRAGFLRSR